jgi:hypothetical protein
MTNKAALMCVLKNRKTTMKNKKALHYMKNAAIYTSIWSKHVTHHSHLCGFNSTATDNSIDLAISSR